MRLTLLPYSVSLADRSDLRLMCLQGEDEDGNVWFKWGDKWWLYDAHEFVDGQPGVLRRLPRLLRREELRVA